MLMHADNGGVDHLDSGIMGSGSLEPRFYRAEGCSIQRLFPDGGSRRGKPGGTSRGGESDKKCLLYAGIFIAMSGSRHDHAGRVRRLV